MSELARTPTTSLAALALSQYPETNRFRYTPLQQEVANYIIRHKVLAIKVGVIQIS